MFFAMSCSVNHQLLFGSHKTVAAAPLPPLHSCGAVVDALTEAADEWYDIPMTKPAKLKLKTASKKDLRHEIRRLRFENLVQLGVNEGLYAEMEILEDQYDDLSRQLRECREELMERAISPAEEHVLRIVGATGDLTNFLKSKFTIKNLHIFCRYR